MKLSQEHYLELKNAHNLLENPSFAAKLTDFIGTPIEQGVKFLPKNWKGRVDDIAEIAITKSLELALSTLDKQAPDKRSNNLLHKLLVASTGAAGGAFGLPALAVELPVSTTIMLRSIADIARANGENMQDLEAKMACVQVFALGGHSKEDDASESGYFALRAGLATSVRKAATHIAKNGMSSASAPALVKLISKIGSRFGIVVSEKLAAQAVPIIGAAGGAIVNTVFIDHFQDMARGHFTVRRLERIYSPEIIASKYAKLSGKKMQIIQSKS